MITHTAILGNEIHSNVFTQYNKLDYFYLFG